MIIAAVRPHRRHGRAKRSTSRPILAAPDRLVVFDTRAGSDALQDLRFLVLKMIAGMIVVIGLPIISSAEYPNRRWAPGFQLMMTPSRSLLIIASSDDSTMLANCRRACSPLR